MQRILVLLDHRENRRQLAGYLSARYEVLLPDPPQIPDEPFSLGIVDRPTLARLGAEVEARRTEERSVFLPFLLVISRQGLAAIPSLPPAVDDILLTPVQKSVLMARVEMLLRARRFSVELRVRNEDLLALVEAMNHDLRAPLRVIDSFVEAMRQDANGHLGWQALHYLHRIETAAGEAITLVDLLSAYSRLGHGALELQPIPAGPFVQGCLIELQQQIQARQAQVRLDMSECEVLADPRLLKTIMVNLIGNALEYVAPGTTPRLVMSSQPSAGMCHLQVQDNGIGIAAADQGRIWTPFTRLHGVEEYAGTGLGLAAVRKAAELMDGMVGVESALGCGSTFWFELPLANQGI